MIKRCMQTGETRSILVHGTRKYLKKFWTRMPIIKKIGTSGLHWQFQTAWLTDRSECTLFQPFLLSHWTRITRALGGEMDKEVNMYAACTLRGNIVDRNHCEKRWFTTILNRPQIADRCDDERRLQEPRSHWMDKCLDTLGKARIFLTLSANSR